MPQISITENPMKERTSVLLGMLPVYLWEVGSCPVTGVGSDRSIYEGRISEICPRPAAPPDSQPTT